MSTVSTRVATVNGSKHIFERFACLQVWNWSVNMNTLIHINIKIIWSGDVYYYAWNVFTDYQNYESLSSTVRLPLNHLRVVTSINIAMRLVRSQIGNHELFARSAGTFATATHCVMLLYGQLQTKTKQLIRIQHVNVLRWFDVCKIIVSVVVTYVVRRWLFYAYVRCCFQYICIWF